MVTQVSAHNACFFNLQKQRLCIRFPFLVYKECKVSGRKDGYCLKMIQYCCFSRGLGLAPLSGSVMLAGQSLHIVDYVVIAGVLAVSMGIGVYHAISKGGNRTTTDYFLGGRSQGILPISISLFASFISSILILGFPAEVYTNGGMFIITSIGICIGAILSAIIFVPVFYPLKLTSVNKVIISISLELIFQRMVPKST